MKNPIQDQKFAIGLALFFTGFIAFVFELLLAPSFGTIDNPIPFFLNFLFFWIYFFTIRKGRKFPNLNHNILLLLIGNVSAYSLNRLIPVFNVSTNWLASFLVILNGAMLLYCFRKVLPRWVEYSLPAIFAGGFIFNFYECFYVAPYYPLSLFGALFFLISLHIFIPLWWSIVLGKLTWKYIQKGNNYFYSALIGITIPLAFVIGYTATWHQVNQKYKKVYVQSVTDKVLPPAIALGEILDDDWQTEKILKSNILYTIADFGNASFFPSLNNFGERKKHDPLVVIASFFSSPLKVKHKDKLQLLSAVFNQRHQTERKLWSGRNLSTEKVATTIQFFPEYRVAYTEKIIEIANNRTTRWRSQQEALYSFYLPEGSVVTSASLWVEGEERPSFLTTKNRADSAYTAIVGRERRDPLLLHWQEGNRVTVRVFPVTNNENRQFKIGITTPLQEKNGQLIYQNPDFAGPYWENATETIRILGAAEKLDFLSQLTFSKSEEDWIYEGKYHSDWQLKVDAPSLAEGVFSFKDQHFQLREYAPETIPFEPNSFYLDLNKSWSKRQYNAVWEKVKYQSVYVYTKGFVRVTPHNKDRLFKELSKYRYRLFPFHKITNPSSALVITQNETLTPVLSDLKGSKFANAMTSFFNQTPAPIAVFDLGDAPSLYLKSLKELRQINYYANDMETLQQFLTQQIFIKPNESADLITLPEMGFSIQKIRQPNTAATAPDHLMRLYTYNHLMQQIGKDYFNRDKLADELIEEAEVAHVVTPVSSLIVLETQADYDRFDIKKNKDSLKNASVKDAGSVPEPQEWLLIILSLALASWLYWKSRVVA